jgi:hypothetical protein
MNTDTLLPDVLDRLAGIDWPAVLLVAVPVALTLIATMIGLAWTAQGMWQAATTVYHVPALFAGVLFLLFETYMLSAMLRANRFRADHKRRDRAVRFVWSLAVVGGSVVALAEGWHQAPLRFAVPLLVAWNWYLDLTADDDPDERQPMRRNVRLAKLALSADDAIVVDMHGRLARANGVLKPPAPAKPKSALEIPRREIILPREGTQGVHVRDGQVLRGTDLKADALVLMRSSMSADRPRGMTIAELAAHYDPPLKQRTAETFAAEARRMNGHDLTGRP